MAFLFSSWTRRRFLQTGAAMLAASRLNAAGKTTRWALLSDTHSPADPADVFRGFRPYDNLKRAVSQVLDTPAEAAYVNGDLARNRGTSGEYQSFKQLVAPLSDRMPLAMGMGNHDDRDGFLAAFISPAGERQPVNGKQVTVIQSGPVRLIFLDSLFIPGQVPGFLGKEQRAWLDNYLGNDPSTPALVFVHHTLGDDDGGLLDADRLLRIAIVHRNVKAVFYGHSHRYQCDALEGLHLVNLPAVGYNFADNQPVGWVAAEFSKDGCDLRLHANGGNRDEDGKTRSLAWRS
jgi:3',5'-cyclic AMP phosphodiesterase CpdA